VNINSFLLEVATTYDRAAGVSTPTQRLLKRAGDELGAHVPGGILVKGSGGQATATFTPWVGFFDPDETASPQSGLYLVYLFSEDLQHVTLLLNQGITRLVEAVGWRQARERLAADAAQIREALPADALAGLDTTISLGSAGSRQRAYEAGSIAARRYDLYALPSELELRADLQRMMALYQLAVATKRSLLQTQPGSIASASALQQPTDDPLKDFKPKSSESYVAHLAGKTLTKSRRHEQLIAEYGAWAAARGFRPSTKEHPKDLVLRRDDLEWLVEAKVLYQGNATDAARAALGQLYAYRHFLYEDGEPQLVALFSEPIGYGYVVFLEACGIASVWKDAKGWRGSPAASAHGIAEYLGVEE
jgi:MrcB-like, N-terminal domain